MKVVPEKTCKAQGAPYDVPMRILSCLFLGTLALGSSFLAMADGKDSKTPKKEWVWLNGSLVYVNPWHLEAKSPSTNVKVDWKVVDGKVIPKVSEEVSQKRNRAFDPYLESAPRTQPGITSKVRFKKPKVVPPPEVPIGFRNGDLPDPVKEESEAEEPLPEGQKFRIEDLTAPQLQKYGVSLQEESKVLKKRFEEITKSKHPDPADLKEYLKDSAEFQVRLEAYRDRADELREETAKEN